MVVGALAEALASRCSQTGVRLAQHLRRSAEVSFLCLRCGCSQDTRPGPLYDGLAGKPLRPRKPPIVQPPSDEVVPFGYERPWRLTSPASRASTSLIRERASGSWRAMKPGQSVVVLPVFPQTHDLGLCNWNRQTRRSFENTTGVTCTELGSVPRSNAQQPQQISLRTLAFSWSRLFAGLRDTT
jgi:hypothetical protein